MPNLETPDELAEQIADWCGVYGIGPEGNHLDNCKCRNCFVGMIERRIRDSVKHDNWLRKEEK